MGQVNVCVGTKSGLTSMVDHKPILECAIKKAVNSGLRLDRVDMLDTPKEVAEWALNPFYPHWPSLLFSHAFAKALWGEDKTYPGGQEKSELLSWQYHLQQMVISEDPIKYLGENI